jgi:hypothetical protein
MVSRTVLAIVVVLAVIFVVPFLVYSLLALLTALEPPAEGSPLRFLSGILVSKAGTAIVFVLIFRVGQASFQGRWLLYGLLWFVMFSIGEVGQAIGPGYSWSEAAGGIVSEAIYCPLSAYFTWRLLGMRTQAESA